MSRDIIQVHAEWLETGAYTAPCVGGKAIQVQVRYYDSRINLMHLSLITYIEDGCCLCLIVIRPPGTTVADGLIFCRRCFFFVSPRMLRAPSTDRPETLPDGRNLTEFYKLTSKIRGADPQKIGGAKNMQNFGQFSTSSDFDREYLRNG